LRAGNANPASYVLCETDGFAAKLVTLAVLGCNRVLAGFITRFASTR
jgi:hypothetical protein